MRKQLKNIKAIKLLSSIKITVVCLLLLFVLTFWGTVAQVEGGLYNSQERYFHSLVFFVFGFIPFPGAQLVLWVLFINLCCVAITRFVYDLKHIGILIIHIGLLTYFVSAFVTLICVEESNLTLRENARSNVSQSYHNWELSLWKEEMWRKKVRAFGSDQFKTGDTLNFDEYGFKVKVDYYYPNSTAYTPKPGTKASAYLNASNIQSLKLKPREIEPEKNIPGGIFTFTSNKGESLDVLLYGGEMQPTVIRNNGQKYYVQLRRKRLKLPFVLKLIDFKREMHPNTDVARSFESLVEIENNNLTRKVLISMNKPLRYKNFTLYQASYSLDSMGRESSTLAVVKNSGRLLPYFSSLITFIGLVVHFLIAGISAKKKQGKSL